MKLSGQFIRLPGVGSDSLLENRLPGVGSDSLLENALRVRARRRLLFDLSPMAHCSVIGTCLTTSELRKVVKKVLGDHVQKLSDHEVHTHGVRFASVEGLPTKLLNKALDEKHDRTIRRFNKAKTESEVRDLWAEAKKEGQIEGAYWAAITHPAASEAFFTRVFGDVHMLSHLVGSSNRADIRRLTQFEAEVVALRASIEETKAAMRAGASRRDVEIQALQRTLAAAVAEQTDNNNPSEEATTLRNLVARLRQQLAAETGRRERYGTELTEVKAQVRSVQQELRAAQAFNRRLEDDLHAFEAHTQPMSRGGTEQWLCDKTILYVGGKSSTIQNLRDLVERLGGSLLHHDGGQEQKIGLLPGLISRADCAFFPVDFVSHQAMQVIKRQCGLSQTPFVALHRSGVASFSRGLDEYLADHNIRSKAHIVLPGGA